MLPYQPYTRQADRPQTPALQAMLAGRGALPNPMDQWRQLQANSKSRGLLWLLTHQR